jgi:GNAT superfamily N-acetyltransferase
MSAGVEKSRLDDATKTTTLRAHRPGDMGWVIHRHGVIYHAEYGWDASFEAMVARVAAEFIEGFDGRCERCFIAERDGRILGSAFVVKKTDEVAKLRLVYVEASERGTGLGRQLVEACLTFAREAGYRRMSLWTNDVLLPARALYVRLGFTMTHQDPYRAFGRDLVGETWERDL